MKAVVLAAGKGERLMPLTENRPKHLLPIGGKPLLEWILEGMVRAGVDEALLVTHYMEEQIKGYFGDGEHLGLDLSYVRQEEMRGTADAFRMAEDFAGGEEFLGVYGDLFLPSEGFKALTQAHRKGETTMCVVPVDNPSRMGVVALEGDRVTSIVEKPTPGEEPSDLANAGIYIFQPGIFRLIEETGLSSRNEYEITDSLKALINSGATLRTVTLPRGSWLDVGLPWNLLEANEKALGSMEGSIEGDIEDGVHVQGPVRIAEGARVRSGAYIEGPVCIGSGSDIGPNCYLRPSTCIGADVRVGNACEVKNSIIMDGTRVPHLSYIGDSVIGERCNLGAGTITANIRFDKKNVKVEIKGERIDSGRRKLGVIIGDDAQTGINVNLLPGVKVGAGAWIAPGLTVYEDIKSGTILRTRR
jgi:bifunctional UDP-N-acetylglucosamine pyrophosphorylase/glucosamine-1-phosphate N-acetyltransferase